MTYREPESIFKNIEISETTSTYSLVLSDQFKRVLEVSFFKNIGWSIEERYDLTNKRFRQPFTGDQEALTRLPLSCRETDTTIIAKTNEYGISLSKIDSSFFLKKRGITYFVSGNQPFSRHCEPTEIHEGLMSLKVSDPSIRKDQPVKPKTFFSEMVRFSYKKYQGPMLGLAGQTGEFNRSGYRFELYNTDEFIHTPERKPMYQSWPVLFHEGERTSGSWICVFWDNPSRTFVDLGDFYPGRITFDSITNNARVYIIEGESLSAVSQKLIKLLGGAFLPPKWAFGYQQSRWSYMSEEEVISVSQKLKNEAIPTSAIYFDIDHMEDFKVFTKNKKHFSNLKACVDTLHDKGFKVVGIADPGVRIDPKFTLYTALKKSGAYLKTNTQNPFKARVWPGKCLLPDFGNPDCTQVWERFQTKWLNDFGFDGIWNDMNEPSNFDGQNEATSKAFTSRGPITQDWNLYGYYMAKTSFESFKAARPNEVPFVISRAGYPGIQKYAVTWHGDNQAWWEHLSLAIRFAVNFSLVGLFYTGADIPGFTGNPPDDLAVRFFQLGSWLPFFRGHSIFFAKDKEPYAFSDGAKEIIVNAIRLRDSLRDEWYESFKICVTENRSPLMPVFTSRGTLIQDEFLLFDKYLIAPVVTRDCERREVYLPEGKWMEFPKKKAARSGLRWISRPVRLEDIPVYVRLGRQEN